MLQALLFNAYCAELTCLPLIFNGSFRRCSVPEPASEKPLNLLWSTLKQFNIKKLHFNLNQKE
jgi:hypothetical protein